MNLNNKWQPLIYGILIAAGILIGVWLKPSGNIRTIINGKNKISEIINIVNQAYVDTVNVEQLEEKTINEMLSQLDPHSVYIPAKDLQQANEPLEGNFDGIGVEFNILNDTIMVVAALNGGPSQELGIQAGDRIISVNEKSVANTKITNEKVFKLLRGPKGSEVKVEIYRPDAHKKIPYTIKRGTIPIYSVDVSMMLNTETGYIKISRFAATTHKEFVEAISTLKKQNIKNLIVDLRGNPGGYLSAASELADEFLDDKKLIVYTQGREQPRQDYKAEKEGNFEQGKLIVLIDEGSASASEILSGAIQDWDRGLIIGRRSYGKGLVQEPFELHDGSALRLTIARYYTPSGRCIQKTYKDGFNEYEHELLKRYEDGELQDSSKGKSTDTLTFHTAKGRVVHAGGGITPDIFVPLDTTFSSQFITQILSSSLLNQFAYTYTDKHRSELKKYTDVKKFNSQFNDKIFEEFVAYASTKNVKATKEEIQKSGEYIGVHLKALVARQLWRDQGYFTVISATDKAIQKALSILGNYEKLLSKK
jgi:carboxyl-terminal processing protease